MENKIVKKKIKKKKKNQYSILPSSPQLRENCAQTRENNQN
jgi:hypothetical protein